MAFWPVIPIPSPDGRSATLAVRANDESFRFKGKDSKGTTHKSKGNKNGKGGKNKGGKGKKQWQEQHQRQGRSSESTSRVSNSVSNMW